MTSPRLCEREGSAIATIDELVEQVPSKYTLVHLSARRAREINAYYHSLGEGLGRYTPPLVDRVESNKPLSIALEEIAQGKIVPQEPGEAVRVAEQLLGADEGDTGAEVVSLDLEGEGGDEAADAALAEAGEGAGVADESLADLGGVDLGDEGGDELGQEEPSEDEEP